MSNQKTISVLIPTLGREKEVIDTVRSLLQQTRVPDEIVVVDQNGDRFPALDQYLDSIPIVKHIKSPEPGVSNNYNRALENATSEIVLFLDDDIIPDSRLVEMHLENYERESGAHFGGVAGRVEQPSGDQDPKSIRHVGRYHSWTGTISANFNYDKRTEVEIAPGGNMSFYRTVLQEVGGFDLAFDGNGYFFETDGSLKVHRAGYRIVFDPRATLKHLMAPAGGARIKSKATHTYYFVKNGIRLCRKHSPPLALLNCTLRMIFYFAAKSLYNRDLSIFFKGLEGLREGIANSVSAR
jgi:GT2 family glycosyltransferase